MQQIASGIRDVGRGFGVLRAHPRLWTWVVAPAVITLALLIATVAGILQLVDPLVRWVGVLLPDAVDRIVGSLLTVVIGLALSFGGLVVFVAVAGMVAGPFNELLSERIEAVLTGRPAPPFSLAGFARDAALGILHGIRRLIVSLLGLVAVLLVGLIPVIGTVAAVLLGAWLAARAAAYDAFDAVLARRSLRYREKLAYLARHRSRTLGVGATVAGMLIVPGLNVVALGLGAAGATVAVHALEGGGSAGAPAHMYG